MVATLQEKSMIVPDYPIWRLTVEQYHQMIDAGILTEADLAEFLEGLLVTKIVKKPRHSLSTQLTNDLFLSMLPAGWFVNVQEPITTADSEPEPDITIVRGYRRDYLEHHQYPADIGLVVEVSDATLQRDRTLKLRVYASARISCYWILNLQDEQLEVYTEPTGEEEQAYYQQQRIYKTTDTAPLMLDQQVIGQVLVNNLFA
jgi:Uma2 family endonuclease